MPDNPISGRAGNTTRLRMMLSFFNENKSIETTFVSLKDWGMWQADDIIAFGKQYPNIKLEILEKKYKKKFFKYFFLYKLPYLVKRNSVDISSWILRRNFARIANAEKFDTVIISYASWGKIIDNINPGPTLILDTHDFITAQKRKWRNKIGRFFQDEINILRKFDEIWTYSVEEEYIFQQFTDVRVLLRPVSFPINFEKLHTKHKYEVIYVASQNPHNIMGVTWFLNEVLPFLPDIKIHVIGGICKKTENYANIINHGFVDDLDEIYRSAKVVICPMLSGTGVKIKVLEALSYGLPVVTTRRGVDGLINKISNGCVITNEPKNFAQYIIKLLKDEDFYSKISNESKLYFSSIHDREQETLFFSEKFSKQPTK